MEDTTVIFTREDTPRQVVLADAIAAGVLPTWTEAIALIRAVAWQLYRAGASTPIPGLEDVGLFSSGVVHVDGGQPADGDQIAGVGQLMAQLLEHVGAPPQVLDVQRQAIAQPPVFATLLEFHNALDFFARPDSKAVLADFHARAHAALQDSSKNQALEDLKEKTKSKPPDNRQPKKTDRKKPPIWLVAAAGLLVAVAVTAGVYYYSGGSSNTTVSQTANAALATITETGQKLQEATNSVVSKLVGGAEADPNAVAGNASPAAPATSAPRRRAPVQPNTPQVGASNPFSEANTAAPGTGASSNRSAASPVAAPPDAAASPAQPEPVIDAGIYTARDTEVLAPVLVYPQLPSQPSEQALFTRPGQLDLLVLEDGTVAEVRLIPQSDRLQDRMIVSAAKAWRFRPAIKDGRSVRYRVRIPITW